MRRRHDQVRVWQTEGALACDSGHALREVKTRGSKSSDSHQDGDPKASHPYHFACVTLQKQIKLPRWLPQRAASQ